MRKAIIVLIIVICLLTGCKKKEEIKKESKSLICTSNIEKTNDNLERISNKIVIDFTKDISSTMYLYIDLVKTYDNISELLHEKVCKEYKSCEISIDNNKVNIKISGDLEEILGTDKYQEYLDIRNYLIDNNYKCEE